MERDERVGKSPQDFVRAARVVCIQYTAVESVSEQKDWSMKKKQSDVYLTIPEFARAHHVSVGRLKELCENRQMQGAVRFGRVWMLHENAHVISALPDVEQTTTVK